MRVEMNVSRRSWPSAPSSWLQSCEGLRQSYHCELTSCHSGSMTNWIGGVPENKTGVDCERLFLEVVQDVLQRYQSSEQTYPRKHGGEDLALAERSLSIPTIQMLCALLACHDVAHLQQPLCCKVI